MLPAIEILTHPLGLHFGAGRVTVSTVGLVPQVRQLVASTRAVLAVSLHATTDEVRDWICPVNRRWGGAELAVTFAGCSPAARLWDCLGRQALN